MRFHTLPKLILEDLGSVHAFLELPDDSILYEVRATPICELIEQIFSETGERFEYNDEILERCIAELGLPRSQPDKTRDGVLGGLVYNAQHYVVHDYLLREGYARFTQELIDQAGELGLEIEFQDGTRSRPKKIGDKWCAWVKHSQTKSYRPDPEIPVRQVQKAKK